MSEATSRAVIDALVTAINARDLQALDDVFTEDVVMEWPQSGERIKRWGQPARDLPPVPFTSHGHAPAHHGQRGRLGPGGHARLRRRRALPGRVHLFDARREDRQRGCVLVEAVSGAGVACALGRAHVRVTASGTSPARAPRTPAGAAPACSSRSGRTRRPAPRAACPRRAGSGCPRRRPAP